LKALHGVQQVHPCFGQPDIFSFIEVNDEKALSDIVISKIHTIDGVEETDTHIVAET
jgi:DNA-binding Lrp family transcriptional regulator